MNNEEQQIIVNKTNSNKANSNKEKRQTEKERNHEQYYICNNRKL